MNELFNLHHDHVFLRREALDFGYDDRNLRDALQAQVISRVRQGAYVPAAVWKSADDMRRHQLRSHAVLRSHKSKLALSHTSAAVEFGLRLHEPDLSRVHVTCLDAPIARTTHDVVYHRLPGSHGELVEGEHGVQLLNVLRTALDTASSGSVASGLVILDGVVDTGKVTMSDLHAAHASYHGPGSRKLQITVRLVREGAESAGESLGRHLCWAQHIPEPQLQFEVFDQDGVLIGRCDYAWPELGALGEFDGITKYLRLRWPGESIEDAVIREKRREDMLREVTGWLMIRLIWADLFRPVVTGARIKDTLARAQRLRAS